MKLFLAPMEGVVDVVVRDLLTSMGGIDFCVTEFVRVTDKLLPDHVFFDICPELRQQSRTPAGTPVVVQLLGGQPEPMAANAVRLSELGATGIDLNFGCPAKTVNRHDGGSCLLQYPERIFGIVSAVRAAVPPAIPVSVKIRLGFHDPSLVFENAAAVEAGGASYLTVHCRTKADGYRPPAYWEWMARLGEKLRLPMVANGEIWSREDFLRCREVTGCDQFMIGRGAMANPFLFQEIKSGVKTRMRWSRLLPRFFDMSSARRSPAFAVARSKQWLVMAGQRHPHIREFFKSIKVITDPQLFRERLAEVPDEAESNFGHETRFQISLQ